MTSLEGWTAAAESLGLRERGGPRLTDLPRDFDAVVAGLGDGASEDGAAWMHGTSHGREVVVAWLPAVGTFSLVRIAPPLGLGLLVEPARAGDAARIGYAPFDERLTATGDDPARIALLLKPKRLDGMSSADQLVALATRPYRVRVTDSYVALGSGDLDADGARLYERIARSSQIADRLAKKRTHVG